MLLLPDETVDKEFNVPEIWCPTKYIAKGIIEALSLGITCVEVVGYALVAVYCRERILDANVLNTPQVTCSLHPLQIQYCASLHHCHATIGGD